MVTDIRALLTHLRSRWHIAPRIPGTQGADGTIHRIGNGRDDEQPVQLFECSACENVYLAVDKRICSACEMTVELIPATVRGTQTD